MITSNISVPSKVLCYHAVHSAKQFEKHLVALQGQPVLLTFDDGDLSVYKNAFPLLKAYRMNAVLFVITSLIDTDTPYWWDEIPYYLGAGQGKEGVALAKKMTNQERIAYLEDLRKNASKPPLRQPQLTTTQLLEMKDNGIIIGNHSHTHPMFDQCSDAELRFELAESRTYFERTGLNGFNLFAYPNGNWSARAESILQEFGVTQAFLFDHQINRASGTNPLRLSRLSVNDTTPVWKFRLILSGLHSKMLPLRLAFKKMQ